MHRREEAALASAMAWAHPDERAAEQCRAAEAPLDGVHSSDRPRCEASRFEPPGNRVVAQHRRLPARALPVLNPTAARLRRTHGGSDACHEDL